MTTEGSVFTDPLRSDSEHPMSWHTNSARRAHGTHAKALLSAPRASVSMPQPCSSYGKARAINLATPGTSTDGPAPQLLRGARDVTALEALTVIPGATWLKPPPDSSEKTLARLAPVVAPSS